jgi:hypothetical protein
MPAFKTGAINHSATSPGYYSLRIFHDSPEDFILFQSLTNGAVVAD